MMRLFLAALLVAALAGCEPDYSEAAAHGEPESAAHTEVTGPADPTAISGPAAGDTSGTIHHPAADGNAGRPADRKRGA